MKSKTKIFFQTLYECFLEVFTTVVYRLLMWAACVIVFLKEDEFFLGILLFIAGIATFLKAEREVRR